MELAQLKAALHKLAPGAVLENALAITPMPTGLVALDQALALGGLPAARVTEISGPSSSGKTAFALHLLAQRTRAGELVAFIDGARHFYPPAAAAFGIDLQRLLLVRPPASVGVSQLSRAAEIIAHSRAFSVIAIDLPARSPALSQTPARRVRTAAQSTGTTLLVLCERTGMVEGASARICASFSSSRRGDGRPARLRVVKGSARADPLEAELELWPHRFDDAPARAVAPPLLRRLPGEE